MRATVNKLVAGEKPWPLTLAGGIGAGKTCVGLCMVDTYGGWYMTVPELYSLLIAAQKGELAWSTGVRRTETEIWHDIRNMGLLVLDELGQRARATDFQYEALKQCMDYREGKPLVLITNVDSKTLRRCYDDRIVSRLQAGTIVRMEGDRRR